MKKVNLNPAEMAFLKNMLSAQLAKVREEMENPDVTKNELIDLTESMFMTKSVLNQLNNA